MTYKIRKNKSRHVIRQHEPIKGIGLRNEVLAGCLER